MNKKWIAELDTLQDMASDIKTIYQQLDRGDADSALSGIEEVMKTLKDVRATIESVK